MSTETAAGKVPDLLLHFLINYRDERDMKATEQPVSATQNDPSSTPSGWSDEIFVADFFAEPMELKPVLPDFFSFTADTESNKAKFHRLAEEWRRDTAKLSLIQKKAVHKSYQRIIGMGKDALPLIFSALRKYRDDWLWALEAITGKDDVAKETDNFDQAVDAWLLWAQDNRYLPQNELANVGYVVTRNQARLPTARESTDRDGRPLWNGLRVAATCPPRRFRKRR